MIGVFASLGRVAKARVRDVGRRAQLRASLAGGALLFGLIALGFALLAATVALAEELGLLNALLVMAGGAFVIAIILIVVMKAQARRDRRMAAARAEMDSRLLKAAAVSMVPGMAPSRPVLGLGLLALGALMVLGRRGGGRDDV